MNLPHPDSSVLIRGGHVVYSHEIDMETGTTSKYQVVRTKTEKLHLAFRKKYVEITERVSIAKRQQVWKDYLSTLEGVEYLARERYLGGAIEYLLDHLNNLGDKPFGKMIIEDPSSPNEKQFILVSFEVADKALVLGGLP